MARKQPVGYVVRRPLTLWGKRREIGDVLKVEEVISLARIDAMVRAGRLNEIYDETDRGSVVRGRTGLHKPDISIKPKRKYIKKAAPVVEKVYSEEQ